MLFFRTHILQVDFRAQGRAARAHPNVTRFGLNGVRPAEQRNTVGIGGGHCERTVGGCRGGIHHWHTGQRILLGRRMVLATVRTPACAVLLSLPCSGIDCHSIAHRTSVASADFT